MIRYGTTEKVKGGGRLLRTARIPWRLAYPKMKEIVVHLRRYVKTTDMLMAVTPPVPFHRWYKWVAGEYVKAVAGKPSALTPAQIADLEELPEWRTRGVEGPYPWRESLNFLEACLRANGVVPPVEINKGGFVGLDATPMERLSGTLTCINQSDGKRGRAVTLPPEKQKDLDELCARHKLCWRKTRGPDGLLQTNAAGEYCGSPTFIQEAYGRFKAMYAAQKSTGKPDVYIAVHFPGYPTKHNRQEILGYDKAMQPDRVRRGRRAAKTKAAAKAATTKGTAATKGAAAALAGL